MKQLIISIALLIGLGATFIVGTSTTNSLFMMSSFCLSPFAFIFLGWSLHAAGTRVVFAGQPAAPQRTQSQQPAAPRKTSRLDEILARKNA